MPELRYRRILLKMSGESLMGDAQYGITPDGAVGQAQKIKMVVDTGVELAIVIGGGNIFRGMKAAANSGMDRASADYIGMLATVMNALALEDSLKRAGVDAVAMTAFPLPTMAEPFIRKDALAHLEAGKVLILAGGTGHPFFTTDTAAALRAVELKADAVMKATTVDGVYDKDPKIHPDAVKFDTLDYGTYLGMGLEVMDAAAVSICRENALPILVFDLTEPGNIIDVLMGQKIGTKIG